MSDVLKAKINKRFVDSAMPPETGDTRIWDIELRGFMLRISSSGRKTYCVKYRVNRQQRWMTIGEHGLPWTPEAAEKSLLKRPKALTYQRRQVSGQSLWLGRAGWS